MTVHEIRYLVPHCCIFAGEAAAAIGRLSAAGDPADAEGAQDPPLFTRMPGFHIYSAKVTKSDRYESPVAPDKTTAVEGRLYTVIYYANDGITVSSALQVARNYENAVKSIGGQKVYEFEDGGQLYVTLRVAKLQAKTWAQVEATGNGLYNVHVVFVVGHTDNAGAFDHNLRALASAPARFGGSRWPWPARPTAPRSTP